MKPKVKIRRWSNQVIVETNGQVYLTQKEAKELAMQIFNASEPPKTCG